MSSTLPVANPAARTALPLFAATVFLSATLLFLVQPMTGKALLPGFGGGAAVWTTVMLFFQVALLGGSALVHLTTTRLGPRAAALVHLGLSVVGGLLVPAVPQSVATGIGPAADVLATLAGAYGPAMLAMGGNAALLQHWYARATGQDPYRLYAVSNAGSMLGLAAYPLLLEPFLPLGLQGGIWIAGYALCVGGLAACAAMALRGAPGRPAPQPAQVAAPAPGAATAAGPLQWILLAAIPSSVLLGATQHVTTQVAPLPLLWVVPLAVYLGTWIAAFAAPAAQAARGALWLAIAMPMLVFLGIVPGIESALPGVAILLHVFALAAAGLLCHGRLAVLRPPAERLTGFYLCLSLGGMLGGVANAILAPALFDRLLEYPLALAAACLVAPGAAAATRLVRAVPGPVLALLPALLLGGLLLAVTAAEASAGGLALPALRLAGLVLAGIAALLPRPALALVVLVGLVGPLFAGGPAPVYGGAADAPPARLVASDRDFYGAVRVLDVDGRRLMLHGATVHGAQSLDPARRREMGLYYHPDAGGGRLIAALREGRPAGAPPLEVAAVGLGAGVMACYAGPDLRLSFQEISPAVAASARTDFTFLAECGDPPVEIGDGRLLIAARPPGSLDLVILDAYSGGAVPVHTATVEAIGTYLDRLRPGGALGFHVSNAIFDLAPFIAAAAAPHGATTLLLEGVFGGTPSSWAAVTRDAALVERLRAEGWTPVDPGARRPWRDDFSDLLRAMRLWSGTAR